MADDDFFYPEMTPGTKDGRAARRPLRRQALPWLLCAVLVALCAAAAVWVDLPLRAQLRQAMQAQQAAVQALTTLEAQLSARSPAPSAEPTAQLPQPSAALPAAPPTDPAEGSAPAAAVTAAPTAAAAEEEASAWLAARSNDIRAALPKALRDTVQLATEHGALRLTLPVQDAFSSTAPSVTTDKFGQVLAAVATALRADEAPYRLSVLVPETATQGTQPEGAGVEHRRRRHRRKQRRPHHATSAAAGAATDSARILAALGAVHANLPLRPQSGVEVGVQVHVPGDAAADALSLRLQRLAP